MSEGAVIYPSSQMEINNLWGAKFQTGFEENYTTTSQETQADSSGLLRRRRWSRKLEQSPVRESGNKKVPRSCQPRAVWPRSSYNMLLKSVILLVCRSSEPTLPSVETRITSICFLSHFPPLLSSFMEKLLNYFPYMLHQILFSHTPSSPEDVVPHIRFAPRMKR